MAQTLALLCVIVGALQQPAAVLDNVDLMDLMLKPAYDELQQAMATPPADRKAWAALYQKAARMAELENLLFFRTRAEESRKAEWAAAAGHARQASADVATAALLGLRNARPADFANVRAVFPAVAAGCTACHRAFAREAPVIKP
jgi:cytochrome c556